MLGLDGGFLDVEVVSVAAERSPKMVQRGRRKEQQSWAHPSPRLCAGLTALITAEGW